MVQQMMPMDIEGTKSTVASNRRMFKHIGKLKESGANVAIIFRTVPEEPNNCLVMGPKFLDDTNHIYQEFRFRNEIITMNLYQLP